MSISKDIIKRCIRDKRDEIETADIVFRPFSFEEHGNYVMVGVRHAGKEIDFVISESRIAIQVSYSIKDSQTYTREVTPLIKFAQAHPAWTMLIVTYEEESTLDVDGTVIHVVPAYKWLSQQ